jgi:arginyl-tRNA synthetase
MSATASLTIPSPKIIEKSLGYSSYFTIDIAAITSDEHNRDANKKLSISSNSNTLSP